MTPKDDAIAFVLELGQALHEAGAPAHRLEDAIGELSPRLGIEARVFSSPTGIFLSFGDPADQRTVLLRVDPSGIDLERMSLLDELIEGVAKGTLGVGEAREQLAAIARLRPRYPGWMMVLAFALASATVARFLGGGGREIAAAALIGLQTGLLTRWTGIARVVDWIASLAAGATSVLLAALFGPLAATLSAIAGLIVIVPGLTLTVALTELATRNLVAGTARMAGAAMTFLAIGLGLAVGAKLAPLAGGNVLLLPASTLPSWTEAIALVLSPIALTIGFRARPRDGWVIFAAGAIAFGIARFVASRGGPELGMLAAAFATGLLGNAYARVLRRPAAVPIVPALLFIVPGTLGVRGVESLVARDVVPGVELLFTLIVMVSALAAGLLFANLALPPRKSL